MDIFRREKTRTNATPILPRTGVTFGAYTESNAMTIATVFRCVRLLSESVANLPMQYLRLRNGVFEEDSRNSLWYLLNVQPNEDMNAFDFWRDAVQNILLEGNAFIIPEYDAVQMSVSRLTLCRPRTVTYNITTKLYTVADVELGLSGTYTEQEIIHLKGPTMGRNHMGLSVISFARMTVSIASTGDAETRNRFANGGNVRGIVSNDTSVRGFGEYQDDQLNATAQDLDSRFQSGERIVGLPGQAAFQSISLSSTDMQFLESRKFTVREICRFFGVHPSFVFDDTSNNYKSAEQANVAFLSHTLNPLLKGIEVELTRKLLTPKQAFKQSFKFDRRGLYASDLDGMMRYRQNLLQTGTTLNEVRKMENLPPVEGGDTVLISANLRTLPEIITQQIPSKGGQQESLEDGENQDT